MRVLIVGAGINGLCAAWVLKRAGHTVAVFDSEAIPNRDGTSYDQHRLIRTPYGSQRGYTRMMAQAWSAWGRLWRDLDRAPDGHYVGRIGCLALSTAEGDWTDRSAATMDALGIGYARIAPRELPARFPVLRTEDARFGLYDADGGILYADRIMNDLAVWLAAHDVALHSHTRVTDIDAGSARLRTRDGTPHDGDVVLVTAGVWAAQLFPALAPLSTPLRQIVAYVAPPPDLVAAWAASPAMLDLGGPRGMYLAPPAHGRGFKIGAGAYNRPCTLDEDATPRAEDGPALLAFYRDRFQQWGQFRVLGLRMCRYANEPDQRFILHHDQAAWVLTGCSGHGFKFGPLMGEALATASLGHSNPAALRAWVAGESELDLADLA
jgi:glycine/D-amino acid oxidase-like deaminating enzyme